MLRKNEKPGLITFITAGDPNLALSESILGKLPKFGADIIELGMPFSDPMADGPVIQRASERALAQKTNTDDVFNIVKEFRIEDKLTPIILMGYLNPIEIMGYSNILTAPHFLHFAFPTSFAFLHRSALTSRLHTHSEPGIFC